MTELEKKYGLTSNDIEYLKELGFDIDYIEQQLLWFEKGFPHIKITAPARIDNNGIKRLEEAEKQKYAQIFEQEKENFRIKKFVPASGAASRMFKFLFEFIENPEEKFNSEVEKFISNIEKFAFFNDLNNAFKKDKQVDIREFLKQNKGNKQAYKEITEYLLLSKGLNYGDLPKALIKFHKYPQETRTAFEEHFVEAKLYAKTKNTLNLHFTIPPQHKQKFNDLKEKLVKKYKQDDISQINVNFSEQDFRTNTIAVDLNNQVFRTSDGKPLMRPAGHGALLKNLNNLDADIVFIKNIDNVTTDKLKPAETYYKKILAGMLIEIRNKIFDYLNKLLQDRMQDFSEIFQFLENQLSIKINFDYKKLSKEEQKQFLMKKLNRPVRVCGMVKNEGQPGGGPFFVDNGDGTESLQIVELAQIDTSKPEMKKIVDASTHFNPVDIVCYLKDYKGNKFDLSKFVDHQAGIITQKSKYGKPLKALELPGLWNGAMSDWNTVFVEIPSQVFNPVKTVNDLLNKGHLDE